MWNNSIACVDLKIGSLICLQTQICGDITNDMTCLKFNRGHQSETKVDIC